MERRRCDLAQASHPNAAVCGHGLAQWDVRRVSRNHAHARGSMGHRRRTAHRGGDRSGRDRERRQDSCFTDKSEGAVTKEEQPMATQRLTQTMMLAMTGTMQRSLSLLGPLLLMSAVR